jgi:hypothetical protein
MHSKDGFAKRVTLHGVPIASATGALNTEVGTFPLVLIMETDPS